MIMEQRIDDKFPVGMRVLAVDDDPTCLMLLETLLRKCQYHVATTNQAITALKMLRENKDKFDLVISDVHMPDMDGFKLLELVGLELGLPVIMLSAYGDNKLVMKGITHGACDYLLKPVRIEELKNIWQHVIRRKKFDPNDKMDVGKPQGESGEVEGTRGTGDHHHDQNEAKLNRKRKDQNEDEDEEHDENGNEDTSTQKKPHVVWSVELHRKFVTAVNHLGIEKAVPKRILDLMNVEKLTRENVASHLQKYRLYLKRISSVASQQANMMAALGGADSAYMRMASFNGFGNLQTMAAGSGQFQNSAAYGSLSPGSVLNRLNTPSALAMHTLSSSRGVQLGRPQSSSNPILQRTPVSLEFNQMQNNQGGGATTNDAMGSVAHPTLSGFSGSKLNGSGPTNSLFNVANNPMMLEGNLQDGQRRIDFQNQPSVVTANRLNTDFPSQLPDFERSDDNWVTPHSYALSDSFKQETASDLRDGISSMTMNMVINPRDTIVVDHLRFQEPSSTSSIAGENMNSSMNSSIPRHHDVEGSFNQNLEPRRDAMYDKNNNSLNAIGESNLLDPLSLQHNEVEFSVLDVKSELKHEYARDQRKPQSSYSHNSVDSLENLGSVMMAKQSQCGFFGWLDPPTCLHSKQVIPGQIRRLNIQEAEHKRIFQKHNKREMKLWAVIVICVLVIVKLIMGSKW